ncbi:MAG: GIY-YIG nuclease family protein [Candidatus Bathyarchaeota archaeon]|nr:MAG: GIY-YIG nuclease family protein [Candidatus Bathyarchaeota archaeon]
MPLSGKLYVWGERAKQVKEEAGVYAFYNQDRALIYIGGGANLREAFIRHLETGFSDDPRKAETRYYRREPSSHWEERVREVLDEYNQEHGELPELNLPPELPKEMVARERGFYFYNEVGNPLFEKAFSLEDFWEKIGKIPVPSLEFHQRRGDFARWVRDVFKETQLAERIEKIYNVGEDLRRDLLHALVTPHTAECPKCRTPANPVKTWKMAGRPSKTGERLQLTIGLYKCEDCEETFRKVLRKEKIRS